MKISVELTPAPLANDFEKIIKDFIKKLRKSDLKVIETPLSTQVYGCLLYTSPSPRDS